jgi:hypothetical protein
LPAEQLLFAHERSFVVAPLGTRALERDLPSFETNFGVFTGRMLEGLEWDGVVAA